MKSTLLFILSTFALSSLSYGQSCVVTSPANGQVFTQNQPVPLAISTSSTPTAWRVDYWIAYRKVASGFLTDQKQSPVDPSEAWTGTPLGAAWYSGLNGDGIHFAQAYLFDVFGNLITQCTSALFYVNIEGMWNQVISPALPTSGNSGSFGILTFDGTANRNALSYSVDGLIAANVVGNPCGNASNTSQAGGFVWPNFPSTCYPNGSRLFTIGYGINQISDPYVLSQTFTSSAVNTGTSTITLASNYLTVGSVVTFTNSGGALPAPLVAGQQFYWASNPASYTPTATIVVASNVGTVTCATSCGVSASTPIYLRNIQSTNQTTGLPNCDGYYLAASGSGTSFTVNLPTCPNITDSGGGASNFELDVNPFFVKSWTAAGAFQLSATCATPTASATQPYPQNTPCVPGPLLALTTAGTGTQTITTRIRSPYWTGNPGTAGINGGDYASQGGAAFVQQLITLANGSAPMEIEIPNWQYEGYQGKTGDTLCGNIKNTDLSSTTPACTAYTYTVVPDGGVSGVITVNSSGAIAYTSTYGWAQVTVACNSTCAGNANGLTTVTAYVHNHGATSASILFPTFTTCGIISQTFATGACPSKFFTSTWNMTIATATPWQMGAATRPLWLGPMMQAANLNSAIINMDPSNTYPGDPSETSCFSATWPSTYHSYQLTFAETYGTYFELDIEATHWGGSGPSNLSAFLGNIGYNRQSCFTGFLGSLVTEGRTWKTFGYDELNEYMAGSYPFRNPALGAADFPSIVVNSNVATYHVNESFENPWSQSAGTGSWLQISGAATATCLNGWFPILATTAGAPTTYSPCANGTYTESDATLHHYYVPANPIGENATTLPRLYGTGNDNTVQQWDSTYFTQVVVSSGVAEFYAQAHGLVNGQAIRVHNSVNNLNTVKPVTVIDANHFSITYNSALETVPAGGTYTISNDAGLNWTPDGNYPTGTPFLNLRTIIQSVANHPATTWGIIGSTYATNNGPVVQNWEGNPIGSDAAWNYIPSSPGATYGVDATVSQWLCFSCSTSGLATRAFQQFPRSMLWSGGYVNGGNSVQYCRSFAFNPACDRPAQLDNRPEGTLAQLAGMLPLEESSFRLYNFLQDTSDTYTRTCCGWQSNGGFVGGSMSPATDEKQWHTMSLFDAAITLRADTQLQPEANKPYYGPSFFPTDAHTSATYGNSLMITCGNERTYGSFTVNLPAISGGSMIEYILTAYTLSVNVLAGNPSTNTSEFCGDPINPAVPSPGRVTWFVGQPAGYSAVTNVSFQPPSPLPLGASHFAIRVGYDPMDMRFDPVTSCDSGCSIPIDFHSANAYYQQLYLNSSNIPVLVNPSPVLLTSQGLP